MVCSFAAMFVPVTLTDETVLFDLVRVRSVRDRGDVSTMPEKLALTDCTMIEFGLELM